MSFPSIRLSTPEDIDGRHGERRYIVDAYELHADSVDTIRLALMAQRDQFVWYLEESDKTDGYWYDELWAIERACRALGIED